MYADTVTVYITSTATNNRSEKRFPTNITVLEFKMKLELISGCHAGTMKVQLFDADDSFVDHLTDDSTLLSSLPIKNGMRIHVTDPMVKLGQFDDVSEVKKFELTNDQYAAKQDTVRAFKARNKLGQFKEVSPNEKAAKETELTLKHSQEKEAFEKLKVDSRCRVLSPNQPPRLGCIKYLGKTNFKEGLWVGVEYDEPVGKNDGSVGGYEYFKCTLNYGGFVRPLLVEAGDFPKDDLGLGDDDEM